MVEESILKTVKSYMGYDADDTSFDVELIVLINASLFLLRKSGVSQIASISGPDNKWSELIVSDEQEYLDAIKGYVCIKTKLTFDPSASATITNSLKEYCDETFFTLMCFSATGEEE